MHKRYAHLFHRFTSCTVYRCLPANVHHNRIHNYVHELRKQLKLSKAALFSSCIYYRSITIRILLLLDLPNSFPSGISTRYLLSSTCHFLLALIQGRLRLVSEPLIVVTDHWTNGYFHWITEALPRALLLSRISGCKNVLIPCSIFDVSYVTESLHTIGLKPYLVPSNRILFLSSYHTGFKCNSTGNYWPNHLSSLRYTIRATLMVSSIAISAHSQSPIWISRRKASRRHILNEDELIPILLSRGFKVVYLEDLSFTDQLSLALNTTILAGPHGAGLSLMIAMSSGTSLLEVRSTNDSNNNCYFNMAASLGITYYYAEAKSLVANGQPHLMLDPMHLRSTIDLII